jgi:hypothetical protein
MKGTGFTGCGKAHLFEGYGLQAVRKCFEMNPALAAEGCFRLEPALFPQPVQPVTQPT